MDLRIIKINAKATCGDSFILKKITAAYNYADGSRVGDPVGYNYLVALPDRMLEDLKVRVDGDLAAQTQQIQGQYPDFSVTCDEQEEWISVLVDEDRQKVLDVLSQLQKTHRIKDMQLEEISTEEVIKKIYEEGVR